MRRAAITTVAFFALIAALPLAQGEGPADETRITLRDEFLRIVNHDRVANGLTPVSLDPQASAMADDYCRDQIRNGTTGHFGVDGLTPYMRYSFAGGNDGVSENAAAWSATYRFSDRALYDMIQRSERAMIGERAPHDGHRRTILDPSATNVGIGLAWQRGEFRLTQEFIRHYVDWSHALPRNATENDRVSGAARPVHGFKIEAVSVHHEPLPRPLTAAAANAIDEYSLPEKRRDYLPRLRTYRQQRGDAVYEVREQYADGRRGDFVVASDGAFTFNVPFVDGPGVYTVVVWVRGRSGAPIAASNVSIRVDRVSTDSFSSIGGGTK
jgi:uncharacterized protein YkwD